MKIPTLLFALALFSGLLMGAEEKADAAKEKPSEVYGNVGGDSTLDKLIAIPGVEPIYKQCDIDNATKKEMIPNCIWEKVKLNTTLKSQVMQVYNDSLKGKNKKDPISGRAPASAGVDSDKGMLTARELAVKTDYQSDPAVQALSDFYSKKLNEVLEGTAEEQKDKKIVTVDHEKFSQLYKSELGKNIVGAFTSYCLNTDPNSPSDCATTGVCKYDPEKKDKNLELLKAGDLSDKGVPDNRWVKCIFGIPKICYKDALPQDPVSKTQACLVMDFVKAARKNIISIDSQKKFYDELKTPTTMAFQNFKPMDAKKSDNDSLTQLTSNDLEKEFTNAKGEKTSVKAANEALKKEADECVDDSGAIKALDKCKKLLNTDVKENDSALAEFGIRQEIQGEKLTEKLKDAKSVSEYLKEEGYTDDVITKMTDATNLGETKKEILERFDTEKKAFILSMQAKIDAKTSKTQGNLTDGDKDKLAKVKLNFSSRTKDLQDLIKFNNIVSSYLTVTDENNKTKPAERNTASIFAEIGSMSGDDAKDYQKSLEGSKLSDKKNSTNLNVKEINEILYYKTQKLDPKKKAP